MTLALDGGTPVRSAPWPSWPPPATSEQRELLLEVLDSGAWGSTAGTKSAEFAGAFARSVGAEYGVCVVNATVGLFLALRAAGVGRDDEVIVPAYTFVASATAVVLAGARPVFADVRPDTLHLDLADVERLIGPRTKAILPVHLAGGVSEPDALLELARAHRIPVVEDAAQAHGATWQGRSVGSFGDLACFSFQSSKAMTAGEGGLIVTDDEELYQRVWAMHNVGRRLGGGWYEHPDIGWNLRMTEFQAAVLIPQLPLLDEQIAARERGFAFLQRDLKAFDGLELVADPAGTTRHSRHLAMLRYDADVFGSRPKADFVAAMTAEGVPVDAGYRSLSREPALSQYGDQRPCPTAEAAEDSVVWIRQSMLSTDEQSIADITLAAQKIRAFFAR